MTKFCASNNRNAKIKQQEITYHTWQTCLDGLDLCEDSQKTKVRRHSCTTPAHCETDTVRGRLHSGYSPVIIYSVKHVSHDILDSAM